MARALHTIGTVWDCAAVVFGVLLSMVAIGCIIPTPADFDMDSGVNSPPFIVWDSANPPFVPTLTVPRAAKMKFTLTTGDINLEQSLEVRLCLRDTDASGTEILLYQTSMFTGPSNDGSPLRKPVVADQQPLCQSTTSTTGQLSYLFVVVTDGLFYSANRGCETTPGSGVATAYWTFTCTD